MTRNSTRLPVLGSDAAIAVGLVDEWFDPIEAGLRDRVRDFIQRMIESELEAVLSRRGYARRPKADPRTRARAVSPATGTVTDRARIWGALAGWRSPCRGQGSTPRRARPQNGRARRGGASQRRPKQADSLIAGASGARRGVWAARSAKIP